MSFSISLIDYKIKIMEEDIMRYRKRKYEGEKEIYYLCKMNEFSMLRRMKNNLKSKEIYLDYLDSLKTQLEISLGRWLSGV